MCMRTYVCTYVCIHVLYVHGAGMVCRSRKGLSRQIGGFGWAERRGDWQEMVWLGRKEGRLSVLYVCGAGML